MVGRRLFGFVPVGSWFGRAEGLRTKRSSPTKELGHGGLCPRPLRKLSFLRTFLLLPPLRTMGAAKLNAGASHYHNGAAPSVTHSPAPETFRSGQAATTAAQSASLLRGSSWLRALPARLFGRRALRNRTQAQAATTAAQRRQLRTALHQKRSAADKPPPRRRSPRLLLRGSSRQRALPARVSYCASATACKLSLRRRKLPQRRSCQTKPSLMEGSSTMMKWPTSRMVS